MERVQSFPSWNIFKNEKLEGGLAVCVCVKWTHLCILFIEKKKQFAKQYMQLELTRDF